MNRVNSKPSCEFCQKSPYFLCPLWFMICTITTPIYETIYTHFTAAILLGAAA